MLQPTPTEIKWTDVWSTWIAVLALSVSVLNSIGVFVAFYLQRRDKKPRLRVEFERTYFPLSERGPAGGNIAHPIPSFTIRLRNPTEKTIRIQQTSFVGGKKHTFIVPNNWKTVDEIPSHDHRAFAVSVIEFEKWAKLMRMTQPEKGRFVLIDAIGNEHKSWKVGDSLSMAPTKLP